MGGWGLGNSGREHLGITRDGAGLIFLGEGTWVLNHNRLGGVGGWGWGNNVPGRGHLHTESWLGGVGGCGGCANNVPGRGRLDTESQ